MSRARTDTDSERIARLEGEVAKLRELMGTMLTELRARGLKSLPAVPDKPTKLSAEGLRALKRQQLDAARRKRWPKKTAKKGRAR